ncbi:MAG: tRNA (adenosine(37)-N6)-threonylcarbamoyltransferase complex transferase subunit TsaD [Candidatus Delongbacteria bacterium]|nr:tRNA (adenosine(37)-N6)-threonylcarbamoyltransferase complex transferase subunit TsaD [Candidatus Delongbacteria bacterium]
MRILAIESSCDETAAAVIDGESVLSSVVSSQQVHRDWGGVVPELASREHLRLIQPVVQQALKEADTPLESLEGIAATRGPGLAGSLMVGYHFAKALALGADLPFLAVNHMEGHIYASFLDTGLPPLPTLVLVISGGHTQLILMERPGRYRLLGQTLDDAAGEAFDKVSKLLGLGYPGGPAISKAAVGGDPTAFAFPRGLKGREGFDFSFSGLKTAVLHFLREHDTAFREARLADICASFQQAIVDPLVGQTLKAARAHGARALVLAGGVAANRCLRERLETELAHHDTLELHLPPIALCTDNAVMIARAAHGRLMRGERSDWALDATPRYSLLDLDHERARLANGEAQA